MVAFEYTIKDEMGLHARPAGMMVREIKKFNSRVTLYKEEQFADVSKLFAIMGLGVKKDDTIKIVVEGADEEEAVVFLEEFMKNNF
ncbi:HPr family phosphocarrier protein [Lachnospiraceae bacterium OttesenSCG-928-D06]|nr:HPr family phosphocarrier protein [Lachnospiraceae bacterium OttesenSCG-928-D06]